MSEQSPESLQTLEISINPELFLDTLLMEIRGASLKYSARIKKNRKAKEQLLAHDIEILESQLQKDQILNGNLQAELDVKKNEFEEILKNEAEGAFIRSRVQYKYEGEKPTKLLCLLERYNGGQRYVPQLLGDQGNGREALIQDQKNVENEIF